MGTSTFTGPIKAGDVLDTTGTTAGTIKNVGFVTMAQTENFTQATNVASAGLYKTNIVVPAGSQIIGIDVLKTTAFDGVAQTINVGTSATATELAVAGDNNLSTTLGVTTVIPGNNATRVGNWKDVGTSDVQIYTLSTNTGGGAGIITVRYIQAVNLT
jgi:hypothetical protein